MRSSCPPPTIPLGAVRFCYICTLSESELLRRAVTVYLPPSTTIQYKYITKYNGDVTWEDDPNNEITTPASGSVTQSDSWH